MTGLSRASLRRPRSSVALSKSFDRALLENLYDGAVLGKFVKYRRLRKVSGIVKDVPNSWEAPLRVKSRRAKFLQSAAASTNKFFHRRCAFIPEEGEKMTAELIGLQPTAITHRSRVPYMQCNKLNDELVTEPTFHSRCQNPRPGEHCS